MRQSASGISVHRNADDFLRPMDNPMIQALRSAYASMSDNYGMRLGAKCLVDKYLEDAVVYRISMRRDRHVRVEFDSRHDRLQPGGKSFSAYPNSIAIAAVSLQPDADFLEKNFETDDDKNGSVPRRCKTILVDRGPCDRARSALSGLGGLANPCCLSWPRRKLDESPRIPRLKSNARMK